MTVTGQSVSPKVVLGYDNANRLTSLNRTNANAYSGGATVATALTFDAASRPTAISHTASGNTLGSYALTWDAGNQISSEVSGDGTVNYTYDNAGQLTAASGWRSESYSYDATGNRTMTGYSTGTGNRLASDGTFNYSYDYDGNLLTKTEISTSKVTEYTWDYRNRLTNVKVKSSGGTVLQEVSYRYDPLDRRIGAGTDADGAGSGPMTWQWTVYDGQNPYADFDNSGSLTNRFLSGDAVDQFFGRMGSSGSTAWYLTDQLGSVRDIANTSGTLIDEVSYDSFGKVLSESSPSNGDRFKFTGRELDPTTGQYYYRARYYDAAIGRFLAEDPLRFQAGDPNFYRYVGNHPTFATDPTGLEEEVTDSPSEVEIIPYGSETRTQESRIETRYTCSYEIHVGEFHGRMAIWKEVWEVGARSWTVDHYRAYSMKRRPSPERLALQNELFGVVEKIKGVTAELERAKEILRAAIAMSKMDKPKMGAAYIAAIMEMIMRGIDEREAILKDLDLQIATLRGKFARAPKWVMVKERTTDIIRMTNMTTEPDKLISRERVSQVPIPR